eukprot:1620819-Prymnesium_polylepis.1
MECSGIVHILEANPVHSTAITIVTSWNPRPPILALRIAFALSRNCATQTNRTPGSGQRWVMRTACPSVSFFGYRRSFT